MLSPTLSVIVVNWNVRDLLRDCLRSLYRESLMPSSAWELIVVDNNSADRSAEMVRGEYPAAALVANDQNVGFAKANNQAFRMSRGKYVLLLNPDALVLDHAVDRLVAIMEAKPEVAATGCRLLNPDGSFQRWTGGSPPDLLNVACHFLLVYRLLPEHLLPHPLYLESEPACDLEVGWVSGACMILRREALGEQIFDERFFMYGEDVELCGRLNRAGWKILYTPRARVVHYEGRSLAQQDAEFVTNKLRGLRDIFARSHGRAALLYYDLVVSAGFLLRSIAYGLAARARPGRGFGARAEVSRHFLAHAVRDLIDGQPPPEGARPN